MIIIPVKHVPSPRLWVFLPEHSIYAMVEKDNIIYYNMNKYGGIGGPIKNYPNNLFKNINIEKIGSLEARCSNTGYDYCLKYLKWFNYRKRMNKIRKILAR